MTTRTRYQRLAESARDAGWPKASPATVQGWYSSGLLPPARIAHPGFGVRVSSEDPTTYDQLRALCRLRWELGIRWHHQLAAHLWVAGFAVRPDVARDALRVTVDQLPRYLRRYRRGSAAWPTPEALDADLEEWAASAVTDGGGMGDLQFRGLLDFARLLFGLPVDELDLAALGHLEDQIGFGRARTESMGDASPWLEDAGPGVAMIEATRRVNVASLAGAVDRASAMDLENARVFASDLTDLWAVVGQVLEYLPPGFAGLGLFSAAQSSPDGPALLVVMGLLLPTESRSFVEQLQQEIDLEELRAGLRTLDTRPELADQVRSGLAAQVRRSTDGAPG